MAICLIARSIDRCPWMRAAGRLEPRGARDRAQALACRLRAERRPHLALRDAASSRLAYRLTVRVDLPSGTVTFLFTDVEGSTRLLHELGADAYAEALAEHRRAIRDACGVHGGAEVDTQGDAFFFAFPTAPGAAAAAEAMTAALASGPIRCGPAYTPGRRCWPTKATWATTSTAPPGSPPPGTAARCSSLPRRRPLSRDRAHRPWRAPVQGPRSARACLSARRGCVSTAQVPVPNEPARAGDDVPRPRARADRRRGAIAGRRQAA